MATLYLTRKSGASDVVSNDNVTHPNCVLVLFHDVSLILGQVVTLKSDYFHDIASFESGAAPIQYIMPKHFIFNSTSNPTYVNALTNHIDINLITKEVTTRNAGAKTWILSQSDSDDIVLSANWEFAV